MEAADDMGMVGPGLKSFTFAYEEHWLVSSESCTDFNEGAGECVVLFGEAKKIIGVVHVDDVFDPAFTAHVDVGVDERFLMYPRGIDENVVFIIFGETAPENCAVDFGSDVNARTRGVGHESCSEEVVNNGFDFGVKFL